VWLLAVTYGLTIANIYYCQPLLPAIARSYGPATANLTTLNQVGFVLALVLVVPLGDIVRRRPLVCALLCADAVALVFTAFAPSIVVLLVAGLAIGLTSASVTNILVAYVAADPRRGRAVGTMVSGGLTGILLSRTVAGVVSELVGWRLMFLFAALTTVILAAVLARTMVPAAAEVAIGYRTQLRATLRLAATSRVLRLRSLIGGCVFASFGALWSTVAFLLAGQPYHFSEGLIGLISLVGAAGAVAARVTGVVADRGWQRLFTFGLLALGVVSFGVLGFGGSNIWWLIIGLLAVDLAIHGTHLLNLSVVYGLTAGARSRIASVYMTIYTLGGVVGAAAGTLAYQRGGWTAVCVVGAVFMAVGLAFFLLDQLSSRLRTLPVAVIGRVSRNSTIRGYL
jgi:predicted MFS family arabinose efflux permease